MMERQQQDRQLTSINILNDDILRRVFDYLHFDDKIRLRRTCVRWKFLLDSQLNLMKALRIGHFQQGGYSITSGLQIQCHHQVANHRQLTGTLFNGQLLRFPSDPVSQCYSIRQYDSLHRFMKYSSTLITMLSLGRLSITYRLLMVITHNLPNLEHLELIGCASDGSGETEESSSSGSEAREGKRRAVKLLCSQRGNEVDNFYLDNSSSNNNDRWANSLASFNERRPQLDFIYSMNLHNQHQDEHMNMEERLLRSTLVKSCDLVRECRAKNLWPNLRHLLVKECNLLNEFSLSLILAIVSHTLAHLVIESNQYLTGEFLNYCGPQLKILRLRYCPLLQVKFLEDFVKLKQFLTPPSSKPPSTHHQTFTRKSSNNNSTSSHPQPINSSMFRNYQNSMQDIYCTL